MPKISIIVPAYNEGKKLPDVINCILNQSIQDIELIMVYLDSVDNTLEVIKSFDDSRIKIVYQKEKTGPGGARNLGIKHSAGDYIGFNECEVIDKDYFEKLYNAIIKDNSDIVVGNVTIVQNNKTTTISDYKHNTIASTQLDKFNMFTSGTCFEKLFKASFVKDNNIEFPEYYRWEDCAFVIKAFYLAKQVSFVNDVKYIWHAENWSGEYREFLIKSIPHILDIILKEIDINNFDKKTKKIFVKKLYKSFVRNYICDIRVFRVFISKIGFSFYYLYRFIQECKKEFLSKIKKEK